MVCLMPVMITRKAAMVSLLVWLWQGVPCSSFQPRLPSIIRNAKALQSKLQQAQISIHGQRRKGTAHKYI